MTTTKVFNLKIEDFNNIDWENLLKEASKQTIRSYKTLFGKKNKDLKSEPNNEKEIEIYDFLYFLSNFSFSPSDKHNPFPAFLVGNPSVIDLLAENHITLLKSLLNQIHQPEIQAIFNDLIWIKVKEIAHAKAAIPAYISSAEILTVNPENLGEASRRFERALRLSSQIGEETKLQEIPPLILKVIQKHALTTDNFTCTKLMELLLKTDEHIVDLCAISISAAKRAESMNNWKLAVRYWEIVSTCYHLSKNPKERENAKLKVAEAFVSEALMRISQPDRGHLVACHFFEKAIEAYKKVCFEGKKEKGALKVRKEEVHKLYRVSQKSARFELNEFTIPTPAIPKKITEAIESFKDLSFRDALINLAYMLGFASKKDTLESIKNKRQTSVYSFLANKSTINSDGLVQRKSKSGEEPLNEAILSILKPWRIIRSQYITLACNRITLDHYSNPRSWDWLVYYNPVIPAGHEEIFAQAFDHGLKGNYLIFANLILPQIENSLRHLLESNDTVTSTLPPSGIQQVKSLETVLKEPKLIDIIGEDLQFELSMLLVKDGSNVRNQCCHGTMQAHEFSSENIVYLWQLMLRFCCFSIIQIVTNSSGVEIKLTHE
jgi:hypothetical protein